LSVTSWRPTAGRADRYGQLMHPDRVVDERCDDRRSGPTALGLAAAVAGTGSLDVVALAAHPGVAEGRALGGLSGRRATQQAGQLRDPVIGASVQGATIDDPTPLPPQPVDIDEDETFDEGRTFERRHLVRERDTRARRKKIAHVRQTLGYVRCETCGFDFETAYGERGRDYIECHHRNPLSIAGPSTTALGDLALLCSNCHRMVHRVKPWLTVEQLAALVLETRQGSPRLSP
jgi:hypothetical protein